MALARELTTLLEQLLVRLLAQELIADLKEVAEIATEGQLKAAVGASWAAVSTG